jgi:ribosomal protein L11
MRTNLNFDFDKLHLKEITVLIPKYHANIVSFLTPVLGLYGINVKEFITDFETKTRFINFDIIVPVRVKITKIKTFEIFVKTPYITSILSNLEGFSLTRPNLNALILYKVSLIKSVFSMNRLDNRHKMIYISIRKYIARILKTVSIASVGRVSISDIDSSRFAHISRLKRSFSNFVFIRKIIFQKYGFFVAFSNQSGDRLNYLTNSLSLQSVSITKVNAKLLSLLSAIPFNSNSFYVASSQLSFAINFLTYVLKLNQSSSFFVSYYRLDSNVVSGNFLKEFLLSFNKLKGQIVLLKTLNFVFLKLIRSVKFLNLTVIRLLNYKNANISSNII